MSELLREAERVRLEALRSTVVPVAAVVAAASVRVVDVNTRPELTWSDPAGRKLLLQALRATVRHPDRYARESAAVAMAVLGIEDGVLAVGAGRAATATESGP